MCTVNGTCSLGHPIYEGVKLLTQCHHRSIERNLTKTTFARVKFKTSFSPHRRITLHVSIIDVKLMMHGSDPRLAVLEGSDRVSSSVLRGNGRISSAL